MKKLCNECLKHHLRVFTELNCISLQNKQAKKKNKNKQTKTQIGWQSFQVQSNREFQETYLHTAHIREWPNALQILKVKMNRFFYSLPDLLKAWFLLFFSSLFFCIFSCRLEQLLNWKRRFYISVRNQWELAQALSPETNELFFRPKPTHGPWLAL